VTPSIASSRRSTRSSSIGDVWRVGHEFHARVLPYPGRETFAITPMPVSDINHLLNPITGAGITIQLLAIQSSIH
jgi:hypothetical protein